MYDQLTVVLAARPTATVIPITIDAISQAYQALGRSMKSAPQSA
jgi:hypothetical protein